MIKLILLVGFVLTNFAILVGLRPGNNQSFLANKPSSREERGELTIQLKNRTLTPEVLSTGDIEKIKEYINLPANQGLNRIHLLMQLTKMPSKTEVSGLEDEGIYLLDFIPEKSWLVALETTAVERLGEVELVRWASPLTVGDKMPSSLLSSLNSQIPEEKTNLRIYFYRDVSPNEARILIQKYQGTITESLPERFHYDIAMPTEEMMTLAEEDSVQWIEPWPPPKQLF